MARPATNGCQYFPLDCNFFNDRDVRIVRSKFGAKSEIVLIRLWCMIYGGEGWYIHLDDDEIALMAESMGAGFSADYIKDVVWELCRRGLFDKDIFASFRVLTGEGVQKQYLSIRSKKKIIPIISEYWVVPKAFFEGENEPLLLKLHFFSVSAEKTAVIPGETPVSPEETPQKKEKEKKAEDSPAAAAGYARVDDGVSLVARCYEANIGVLSGFVGSTIVQWLRDYSPQLVCAAIEEAVKHNGRSIAYIEAILRRWKAAGIGTPEAAQAERAAAESQRNAKNAAQTQRKEAKKRDLSKC